jgi:hypothetical protein
VVGVPLGFVAAPVMALLSLGDSPGKGPLFRLENPTDSTKITGMFERSKTTQGSGETGARGVAFTTRFIDEPDPGTKFVMHIDEKGNLVPRLDGSGYRGEQFTVTEKANTGMVQISTAPTGAGAGRCMEVLSRDPGVTEQGSRPSVMFTDDTRRQKGQVVLGDCEPSPPDSSPQLFILAPYGDQFTVQPAELTTKLRQATELRETGTITQKTDDLKACVQLLGDGQHSVFRAGSWWGLDTCPNPEWQSKVQPNPGFKDRFTDAFNQNRLAW